MNRETAKVAEGRERRGETFGISEAGGAGGELKAGMKKKNL
jgi:hypothetical protein